MIQNLRGTGGTIIWLDEAAYVPVTLITNIILPIFEVSNCCLIMVSTLYTHWNFFTRILDKAEIEEKRGNHVINWYRLTLVCDRCMKLGEEVMLRCQHKYHLIPPWKSSSKLNVVKLIQAGADVEALKRESLGIIGAPKNAMFATKSINELLDSEEIRPNTNVPALVIFVTVDPNAGGASNMGICAIAQYMGLTLVSFNVFIECHRGESLREFGPD